MAQSVLSAQIRKEKGKGAARRLRVDKKIPAVFYGPKAEAVMLTVDYAELDGIIKREGGENVIFDLQVHSDQGTERRTAMLKDLVTDPIKDVYLHADFYEISMDQVITVEIPLRLVNTPVGADEGGVLQHVRRELTISCLPGKLVEFLEIDVSGLDIGDSVHVRDIALPEGITTTEEEDVTIAVVAAPAAKEEEEVVEGVEGEPEEEAAEAAAAASEPEQGE